MGKSGQNNKLLPNETDIREETATNYRNDRTSSETWSGFQRYI
jgi:hypothetical protein